jgi:hypothetical protein
MFASDAATFLADFGDSVSWSPSAGGPTVTGLMIFDQPDLDLASGEIISREYQVTFEAAAWMGLKRGENLIISGTGGGSRYTLRADPHRAEDGVFARAMLSKV